MSEMGRVLIVDDDADFVSLYRDELGTLGYSVDAASDVESAERLLNDGDWDVVLVDQKLRGFDGADEGLELIRKAAVLAPRAKAILVTAYPSPDAIRTAFEAGAYDYLEKGRLFSALLEVKLRNAVQSARAERLSQMSPAETERLIRATWDAARSEQDKHRKGKLLEDLMVALLGTVEGFRQALPRRKNKLEEIDILIQNQSPDPVWSKEGPYLLVECKNWSGRVDVPQLRDFFHKIRHRFGRCRLGFFVAPGGFTQPFKDELLAKREHDVLVVLVDGADLQTLIDAADRNHALKELHMRALVELNGH